MLFSCTDNKFITIHYTVYGEKKVLSSRGVILFILYLETLLKRG